MRIAARVLLLLAAMIFVPAALAEEDEPPIPVWEPTGLTEPTEQLFTPASGAFFARTNGALARSDDGGGAWLPLSGADLPKLSALAVGIDGRNPYAATERGVLRLPLP